MHSNIIINVKVRFMGEICSNCFSVNYEGGVCAECGYDSQHETGKHPLALPAGSILYGRYRIGRVLGQGGFGITYKAQDVNSNKIVAIKEYFPKELATRVDGNYAMPYGGQKEKDFEYGKDKFLNEAQTLARFNGTPGIVDVYNYFEENGTVFFAMEYAGDINLEKYVSEKGGKLTFAEAQVILKPVFEAIREIHKEGIIHRDIAPDNIMITPDRRPLLIDFGAARGDTGMKSVSMDVVIKYGFAPVEQYKQHGTLSPATDIYAAAATYYYAITGHIPPESIERVSGEDPLLSPCVYGAQIEKKTEDALIKALSVQPNNRYQSMEDFIEGLKPMMSIPLTVKDMLERAFNHLAQKEWGKAEAYFDMVLENESQNAEAYVGLLMSGLKVEKREFLGLVKNKKKITESKNYKLAMQLGSEALKNELSGYACKKKSPIKKIKEKLIHNSIGGKGKRKTGIVAGVALAVATIVIICANVLSSWSYSSYSDTLTIKNMEKYSGMKYDEMPWAKYYDDATAIVIKDGVETINAQSFYGFIAVTSVDLPSTVTQIGSEAFRGCSNLKSINIPSNVDWIEEEAFRDCGSLTSVYLPSGLSRIGADAFKGCAISRVTYSGKLETLSIARGNETLEQAMTVQTAQENISFPADIPTVGFQTATENISASADGLIYSADVIDIPANDAEHNCNRLNVNLSPDQEYTLKIAEILPAKNIEGICVSLYDFANDVRLFSELISPLDLKNICITFKTPATLSADVDIVLYASIPTFCAGIQTEYKGVQLYLGTLADNSSLIISREIPINIFSVENITVLPTTEVYNSVEGYSGLTAGQVYTLSIEKIEGTPLIGTGISVYDFSNNSTLNLKLLDLMTHSEKFKWTFRVPQNAGSDVRLLFFAGIPGRCTNVEMTYSGIKLYTGVA